MAEQLEPLEISVILDLVDPPSLEHELMVEKQILKLKESNDIQEVKKYAEANLRQNLHQIHFISNCLEKVAELQARIICLENPVPQRKKTVIERLFGFW